MPGWTEWSSSATTRRGDRGAVGAVVHDREQVALGEPARGGGDTQRGVDRFGPDQGGELERGGHLRPDPLRPDGGGLDQPGMRARPQREERLLLDVAAALGLRRPRGPVGLLGVVGVVGQVDPRVARRREPMPGHLDQPGSSRSRAVMTSSSPSARTQTSRPTKPGGVE